LKIRRACGRSKFSILAPKERTTASAFGRSKSLILTGALWWGTPSQRTLVLSLAGPRLENLKHEVFETSKVSLIVTERVTLNMFNITCSVTIKHFMFTLKSKILSSIGAPRSACDRDEWGTDFKA
jgi:hypothetical protein